MPSSKNAKTKPQRFNLFTIIGICCVAFSLTLFIAIFWPVILNELRFHTKQIPSVINNEIAPIDTEFGIIIPKIGANAKVIPNVDPYDSRVYQRALTQGVAHAKGTGLPGQAGNIFLFSHSSVNFYEANRYNSVFYLLSKLQKNDEIYLYYQNHKYIYSVTDMRTVSSNQIQYLEQSSSETLTLMTCWPPGTTYKRLLIIAERIP